MADANGQVKLMKVCEVFSMTAVLSQRSVHRHNSSESVRCLFTGCVICAMGQAYKAMTT